LNLSKEIVENFLKGNCSDEEWEAISQALEKNPAALDAYIDKSNWDEIGLITVSMPAQAREHINSVVMQHINKKSGRLVFIKYAAIAAGVIGFLFLVSQLFIFNDRNKSNTDIAQHTTAVSKDTVLENKSNKRKLFRLSDGSEVALSSGSSLRFTKGFTSVNRELYLKGEAWFNVASDKARPFTVYSGALATTALGTSFTIKNVESGGEIDVTLHSGKVVVRQSEQMKDIFLLPGNMLKFNTTTMVCKVTTVASDTASAVAYSKPAPAAAVRYIESTLTFDREPLANVFNTLQTEYKTSISFDEEMLNGLSFTGSIPPTQPLKKVLENIAFVNDLTITGTAKQYKVSRHN
jgi:ferric-dicitrate binding protein FerR (iron transport regulator)